MEMRNIDLHCVKMKTNTARYVVVSVDAMGESE